MPETFTITHRRSGAVLWTGTAESLKAAAEAAAVGADLRNADLLFANLRDADLGGADLGGAIPIVENIDAKILAACTAEGASLGMGAWHTCKTTHCRAGWAIRLAGKAGRELESKVGPATAGTLIYAASRPNKPVPDFYATTDDAMADLVKCAAEAAAQKA